MRMGKGTAEHAMTEVSDDIDNEPSQKWELKEMVA